MEHPRFDDSQEAPKGKETFICPLACIQHTFTVLLYGKTRAGAWELTDQRGGLWDEGSGLDGLDGGVSLNSFA